MPEYYNLTNLNGTTDLATFINSVSQTTLGGNFIGLIVLIIVFCVFFLALKQKGYFTSACFATACWMVSLSALLLRPIGMINDYTWWVSLALTPLAIFVLFIAHSE